MKFYKIIFINLVDDHNIVFIVQTNYLKFRTS